MSNVNQLFHDAVAYHEKGAVAEAAHLYRSVIALDPGHYQALTNLGMTLTDADAVDLFSRANKIQPDYIPALLNLGRVKKSMGLFREALSWLEKCVALTPDVPEVHCEIGSAHQSLNNFTDAIVAYERAIELKPDYIAALHNLATIQALQGRYETAAKGYRWVLLLEPTLDGANRNMVTILESEGRVAEASYYRLRAHRPQPLDVEVAEAPRRTVLLLSGMGQGNIPVDFLVPRKTNTRIKWYADMATDEQEQHLPPYDVAFNVVGNADLMAPSSARLKHLYDRRPFLNHPDSVARTRRDLLPELLKDLPNVVVPPAVRLGRSEVLGRDLLGRLGRCGISFPFLIRPISTQGGEGLTLIETQEQLAGHEFSDADAFFVSAYYNYRSADGFFRKYRTVFVDRVPYHYHLAISPKWLVHYVSAEMAEHLWKREEESQFLSNAPTAIGDKAINALEAISRAMDIDYAGIDYAVLPDGRVLVFEANATMLVHLRDPIETFPYKHVYVPRIIAAFEEMLDRQIEKERAWQSAQRFG